MNTFFDLSQTDVFREENKFGVDEVTEDLLIVVVNPTFLHDDPGPHHRFIG